MSVSDFEAIAELEHENRLLRARNERLQKVIDGIVPRLEQGFGTSHAAPQLIRKHIADQCGQQ